MRVFRRIMLGSGIDIESLPDTQKLYYKATAKVFPESASLGSPILKNSWDSTNGEGVIVCAKDISKIGEKAFKSNTSLISITIPDSVTSIGYHAFHNCTSLISITIPDSVIKIGGGVFYNCISLPTIDNIRYADTYLVEVVDKTLTEYTIKDNTRFIRESAFSNCSNITSITIPDSVIEIGSGAFQGCRGHLIINSSVVERDFQSAPIRSADWVNSAQFSKLTIGNNIKKVGNQQFYGCTSFTSVIISDSVTSIGRFAFSNCDFLKSVTIPDSVTSIGNSAFSGCTYLTNVVIPDGVTEISDNIFHDCASLTNINIPDSVTSIGNSAFSGCTSLTSIIIPDSVTEIGDSAFEDCTSLINVTIPNGVTSIEHAAFIDCTSMQYYDFSTHESVPTLYDTFVFGNIPTTCKIIVPDALYDEWIAATNWSTYASYIIKKSDWDASQTTE